MESIEVRRFRMDDAASGEESKRIRTEVFVLEQGVPALLEWDGEDNNATHYLLFLNETAIATARWRYTAKGIKLERFAMLRDFRNGGYGVYLLEAVLQDVLPLKQAIYLHSQARAVNFYRRRGFEIEGECFEEAGIKHYKMIWPQAME